MDSLGSHRDYLDGEWRALQKAPLSTRKAMIVALLVDAFVDRRFAEGDGGDILDYRTEVALQYPALGQIMALCAGRAHLLLEAVHVPISEYGALPVEDFMVSLYNDHSVQRLRLADASGKSRDMLETLRDALSALDQIRPMGKL